MAKREIGGVGLGEARAVRPRTREDTTGGNVAPRHAGRRAGLCDVTREDGVAEEAVCLVEFARVD